jgi:type IV secretion system protein VirB11
MQAGLGLGRQETMEYARSMIDVVIQLDRHSGQRAISCVELTNAA